MRCADLLQSEAFRNWFGKSATVAANGWPKVFYHGTAHDFTEFSHQHCGSATDTSDSMGVFWFSERAPRANCAARDASYVKNDSDELPYEEGANVIPVFLRIKKLKTYPGWVPDVEKSAKQLESAKRQGFDGVAWELGERMGMIGYSSGPVYAVFEPTQIKSAIGNSGAFDSENPSLTDSLDLAPEPAPRKLKP